MFFFYYFLFFGKKNDWKKKNILIVLVLRNIVKIIATFYFFSPSSWIQSLTWSKSTQDACTQDTYTLCTTQKKASSISDKESKFVCKLNYDHSSNWLKFFKYFSTLLSEKSGPKYAFVKPNLCKKSLKITEKKEKSVNSLKTALNSCLWRFYVFLTFCSPKVVQFFFVPLTLCQMWSAPDTHTPPTPLFWPMSPHAPFEKRGQLLTPPLLFLPMIVTHSTNLNWIDDSTEISSTLVSPIPSTSTWSATPWTGSDPASTGWGQTFRQCSGTSFSTR